MSDFERFGKYLILDHLVDGGMAKICRARYLGEQANKIVAIKMVQAQFSKDPSFVQMFEDELKVTFGLLHPNIAQMYDYGMVQDQLYTAMEYVDGANLKQYLDRLKAKNFVFPVEISTYITSQVCQALHYAHTFTDKLTGKPFNIVHRDISPHNIMLTYDGAVKVIDFGIAKADSNSEATQAGTIKGKLSYLAPEYLDGLELDHRYDQFAVGITLWELLCSRKLFQASNDLAVLKQIQACKVPAPSSINPNVPKELDQIVLKALAKDRNQRFENMDKFNRALVKFLYSNYPDFNATDLGYFANQLFKEEITKDKEKFVEYGKIDIKPYIDDISKGTGEGQSTSSANSSVDEATSTRKIELDLGFEKKSHTVNVGEELQLDNGTKSNARIKTTAARASSGATSRQTVARQRPRSVEGGRTETTTRVRKRRAESSGKSTVRRKVSSQGQKKSEGKGSQPIVKIVACMALAGFIYTNQSLVLETLGLSSSSKVEQNRNVANDDLESIKKEVTTQGSVRFSNLDSGMRIYINNQLVQTQGIKAQVPLNKRFNVAVRKKGYKKFQFDKQFSLTAEQPSLNLVIPDLEKENVGLLSTSQNFTSGSKLILEVDGERIERDLPFNNMRIPAGEYEGTIANPLLGTERKILFEIKENKRLFLE